MTKTVTYLIGMLIAILVGTYFYITCCSSCGITVKKEPVQEIAVPSVPDPTSYPFSFSDGEYACNVEDNFNFNVSSSTVLTSVAASVANCIGSLKDFLAANNGKVINITGFYKSDETNNTAYPNLGLARANAVKNYLTGSGIPSSQINTFGKLMDEMVAKENILLGPMSYSLTGESAESADELKVLYEKIKADPLVLYFDTAESSINLTAEQRQKVADISRYLDKVEGASCSIVGHTDNSGNAPLNVTLGQERADFAKDYLMKNGISETKIKATSKGQSQPIESNATEEGKAKNRRAVVSLN